MLASTFMNMVLRVDIHFEMVPMPAPVPTRHGTWVPESLHASGQTGKDTQPKWVQRVNVRSFELFYPVVGTVKLVRKDSSGDCSSPTPTSIR